jgi:ureidoacrylate peracid hydrolase
MKQALIVIDVQKIYTMKSSEMFCQDADKTVARINKLVDAFKLQNNPIAYIRHQHRKDRSDIGHLFNFDGGEIEEVNFLEGSEEVNYDDRLHRISNSIEIVKTRYSAFAGTDLEAKLRKLGVQRIAVTGFMTNFCCESTARSAFDLDFFVDAIIDATGTPGTDNCNQAQIRKESAEVLGAGFARVLTTEKYLKTLAIQKA